MKHGMTKRKTERQRARHRALAQTKEHERKMRGGGFCRTSEYKGKKVFISLED